MPMDTNSNIIKKRGQNNDQWCCSNSSRSSYSLLQISLIVLISISITFLLIHTNFMTSVLWWTLSVSLWTIFILWLIASLSTCLAVTGWVVVAMSDCIDTATTIRWHIMFQWSFQLWRLLSFVVTWWLLWALGQYISLSLWFTTWLSLILALLFIYLWLHLIKVLPSIPFASARIHKQLATVRSKNTMSFSAWLLSVFLPCGFTQTVQLMALASWSMGMWVIMMLVFALWTLPWLVLLWAWTTYIKNQSKQWLHTWVSVLLLAFGMFTLRWTLSVLWVQDYISSTFRIETKVDNVDDSTDIEKITLGHDWFATVPDVLLLKRWGNYEITILPEQDGKWCMSSIVLPRIDSTVYPVKQWTPISYIIENAQPWQYTFVCSSMWMRQWSITIQ